MKFEVLDKWMTAIKDWHIPACIGIFGIGSVLQWFHKLDSTFVGFTSVIVTGITGHAIFAPSAKPEQAQQKPSEGTSKVDNPDA